MRFDFAQPGSGTQDNSMSAIINNLLGPRGTVDNSQVHILGEEGNMGDSSVTANHRLTWKLRAERHHLISCLDYAGHKN